MEERPQNVNIHISNNTIMKFLMVVVLIFAVIKLVDVILIILTAIVIASFVESGVNHLKPYIKNRTFSVFLIYLATLSSVFGLSYVFIPLFISEISSLVNSLGQYIPNSSILNTFQPETISGAKGIAETISSNASLGEVIKSTQGFISSMSGGFLDIFNTAFGGIFNILLIFIISLFLSLTEKGVENFLRIVTPINAEEYVIDLWQRTEKKIGLWFQGQVLLGIIMGVLVYLGLTIMGVKYSFIIAIITAFCELVPFGIFVAMIPAALFSYLDGGITLSLLSMALFFIFHQFENYLIYPLIVKKVIGISPLVVILSVLIGGNLAGFWGIVLAIPCAVCLLELMEDIEKKKIFVHNN